MKNFSQIIFTRNSFLITSNVLARQILHQSGYMFWCDRTATLVHMGPTQWRDRAWTSCHPSWSDQAAAISKAPKPTQKNWCSEAAFHLRFTATQKDISWNYNLRGIIYKILVLLLYFLLDVTLDFRFVRSSTLTMFIYAISKYIPWWV